jgi:hypothetical protein
MMMMITNVPGRPTKWPRQPWFFDLLTETMNAKSYYKAASIGGNLKAIKPGKVMYVRRRQQPREQNGRAERASAPTSSFSCAAHQRPTPSSALAKRAGRAG